MQLNQIIEESTAAINITKSIKAFLDGMQQSKKDAKEESIKKIMAYFQKIKGGNMPSIRIRESGLLEVRFNYQGKRYSIYERDPVKIFTKIRTKIKELNQEQNALLLANATPTLAQWWQEWMEKYKKPFVQNRTLRNIESIMRIHLSPTFANTKLSDITTDMIQAFLNTYARSKLKDDITIYFKAAITKAYDLDMIPKNPFNAVVQDRKTNKVREALTINEQRVLLDKARNTKYYLPIIVALCTGMRTSELFKLCLSDIDSKHNRIKVHETKVRQGVRFVDVSSELILMIQTMAKQENVFADISADKLGRFVQMILKELKVKNKTFYCCRHSFATNHYFLGTPAKQVQEWMGHSTINMTLNVYTNINDKWDAEEIYELYNNLYCYKWSTYTPNHTPK